jgi:N-glycosidase YbiA
MNKPVRALAGRSSGICGFFHNYRFLSNFWPCKIGWAGHVWPNTEAAYQATKVDPELPPEEHNHLLIQILLAKTPAEAKKLGKAIVDSGKQRKDWYEISLGLMYELNKRKFEDPVLRSKLLQTGDTYLEETNHWGDTFWGVCRGKGENHLGRILMAIREEIKNEKRHS